MKKITLLATLLGSVYFSNAQVGIGTPSPSPSAMLEVLTEDNNSKGVLIPRVTLADTETVLKAGVDQENSLLVYNKAVGTTAGKEVKPGFYYWQNTGSIASTTGKWIRIVNQADLDAVIGTQNSDITKIKALLNAVYGTNNIGGATGDTFGGMVFTPAAGAISAKIEYLKWDGTAYVKEDITSVISSLINANESKTSLQTSTNKKYQYYVSETYLGVSTNPAVTQSVVDGWAASPPTGVYIIDFVNGVSNSFLELSTSVTNITKTGGGFYTVKEYIEMLANTPVSGDTKIVLTGTGTQADPYIAKLQRWDASATPPAWVDVDNAVFSKIVKDNETKTVVKTLDGRTFYFSEAFTGDASTVTTAAAAAAASGVFELHMGNTGFTTAEIPLAQNPGGIVIPANTLYYINATGVKIAIPMNDIVYQGINQFTNQQINSTKLKLGDDLSTTSFTGDTITIGGTVNYIYRGAYTTTVTAKEANTSGVTLGVSGNKILSIDVRYDTGIVASVTDMTLSGTALGFKIGSGKMYYVLGDTNITADVIVEFASTVAPSFVTP